MSGSRRIGAHAVTRRGRRCIPFALVLLLRLVLTMRSSMPFELVWPREALGTAREGTDVWPFAGV